VTPIAVETYKCSIQICAKRGAENKGEEEKKAFLYVRHYQIEFGFVRLLFRFDDEIARSFLALKASLDMTLLLQYARMTRYPVSLSIAS
jgi:hypothetical protein